MRILSHQTKSHLRRRGVIMINQLNPVNPEDMDQITMAMVADYSGGAVADPEGFLGFRQKPLSEFYLK